MDIHKMAAVARAMVARGKGTIAMDESSRTIKKRFDAVGVPDSAEHRRAYREMLLTSPGLAEHVSGAIPFDETIRQSTKAGVRLPKVMKDAGIIPGINVDTGAKPLAGFPGELVTEGLDGLRDRLNEYLKFGAEFAKWRAVIIGDDMSSSTCIDANTQALARYAALCQETGIVPMLEPELLMDGNHAFDRECTRMGIEHHLIRPRHPQTNGMVERFSRRISDVLTTSRFRAREDLQTTLERYVKLYNDHLPQRALGHKTPVHALRMWQKDPPDLFVRRIKNQTGLDSYT